VEVIPLVLAGGWVGLCVVTGLKGRRRIVLAVALCIPVLAFIVASGLSGMGGGGGTPFELKVIGVLVGGFVVLAPLIGAVMRARPLSRWARRHPGH